MILALAKLDCGRHAAPVRRRIPLSDQTIRERWVIGLASMTIRSENHS
jgi:hypothetical protein